MIFSPRPNQVSLQNRLLAPTENSSRMKLIAYAYHLGDDEYWVICTQDSMHNIDFNKKPLGFTEIFENDRLTFSESVTISNQIKIISDTCSPEPHNIEIIRNLPYNVYGILEELRYQQWYVVISEDDLPLLENTEAGFAKIHERVILFKNEARAKEMAGICDTVYYEVKNLLLL